jgi:hypothetical protein
MFNELSQIIFINVWIIHSSNTLISLMFNEFWEIIFINEMNVWISLVFNELWEIIFINDMFELNW